MKFRLMAATAAIALMSGAALAQADLTTQQQTMLESQVTPATIASSEVIPAAEADGWQVGSTVPDTFQIASLDVDGLDGYGFLRTDSTVYVVDADRNIVHTMNMPQATGAGSETIPPVSGDRPDVASPTNQ